MLCDLWLRGRKQGREGASATVARADSVPGAFFAFQHNLSPAYELAARVAVGHTHTHTHLPIAAPGATAAPPLPALAGCRTQSPHRQIPAPPLIPLVSQGAGGDRDPPILRWVQRPCSNSWQREEAGRCGRAARSLGAGAPAREERAVCCRELGTLDPRRSPRGPVRLQGPGRHAGRAWEAAVSGCF